MSNAVQKKQVLHVGCGPLNPLKLHQQFRGEDWQEIRLDLNPKVKPDIVASITDMASVEAGTMDAVWSSHNLEHLYPHEVPLALGEFFRVLNPAGFLLITLPDLMQVAQLIVKNGLDATAYVSPAGPIAPVDILYGLRSALAKGNLFMAHKTGFTTTTLGKAMVQAGFRSVRVTQGKHVDLWGVGYKTLQAEGVAEGNAP